MIFILGIIVGMLMSIILMLVALRYTHKIQRTISQAESRLKEKGSILEPEPTGFTDWVNSLKGSELETNIYE